MPVKYDPSRRALYTPEHRDTLFKRGGSYDHVQLAVEAARLAYYRAEKSDAEHSRLAAALDRVGFSDLRLFPDATTCGYAVRRRDGTTLLAFRGTQPDNIHAILADARADLVPWHEAGGLVHAGFAASARAVLPAVRHWMEAARPDPTKLILTGHSLGAALATLIATVLRPKWLVTLGSPRVGDITFANAFAKALAKTESVRLVDCCDAVTDVPPPVGYVHVTGCRYLTRDARKLENPSIMTILGDRLLANVQYTVFYAWRWWDAVSVRSLADHAAINYARAIFP
jgi:hypothetical protein